MKAKEYNILDRAIEEGVSYGLMKAFKHTDTPTEDSLSEWICGSVMNSICEVFNFEKVEEEE
jgi:hypothetical protein